MMRIPPRRASARICFSISAPARTDFLEAGGDDDGSRHARVHALADQARHGRRRRNDDREINCLRHSGDVRKGWPSEHDGSLRVNRKNFPANKRQVLQHRPTYAAFLLRRADDGDGLRREKRIERVTARVTQDIVESRHGQSVFERSSNGDASLRSSSLHSADNGCWPVARGNSTRPRVRAA